MKNNYYNLTTVTGKSIIEIRQQVLDDDRVINPKYYAIDIDPNKTYLASIIYEDISDLTSIYIEEIIKEL